MNSIRPTTRYDNGSESCAPTVTTFPTNVDVGTTEPMLPRTILRLPDHRESNVSHIKLTDNLQMPALHCGHERHETNRSIGLRSAVRETGGDAAAQEVRENTGRANVAWRRSDTEGKKGQAPSAAKNE